MSARHPVATAETAPARKNRRIPQHPENLSRDLQHFDDVVGKGDDVAAIVVGIGFIDACLGSLLGQRLRKGSTSDALLESSGPLGSFAVRSKLAYSLALIDADLYKDLRTLGELRNLVAHHRFALDFSSPDVIAYCKNLSYADALKDGATARPLFEGWNLSGARDKFMITGTMITRRLILTAMSTKHAGSTQ
jgi:hypothetical protein